MIYVAYVVLEDPGEVYKCALNHYISSDIVRREIFD